MELLPKLALAVPVQCGGDRLLPETGNERPGRECDPGRDQDCSEPASHAPVPPFGRPVRTSSKDAGVLRPSTRNAKVPPRTRRVTRSGPRPLARASNRPFSSRRERERMRRAPKRRVAVTSIGSSDRRYAHTGARRVSRPRSSAIATCLVVGALFTATPEDASASAATAAAASMRPYRTLSPIGTAVCSIASTIAARLAPGCSESSSAASPATSGVADDVPQKTTYPPAEDGAGLQPGAAT